MSNRDGARKPVKRNINPERRAQIGHEKRERTHALVVRVAFDLLGRENGLRTTIDEICAAAGISRGTFYNYFNSMEDLFSAVSYELSHDFNTAVLRIMDQMQDADERTSSAVRYYLEKARSDPKWGWAMVNVSAWGPLFGAETYSQAQKTVEEGIASGLFKLTGPNSGRDMVLGTTLAAMITQLRASPSETYPRSVARHILLGMGVPSPRVEDLIHRPLPTPELSAG